ncbi:MAG TPA: TIGR02757 family protein [Vicinamibacteria bacterium]|nr:TIGR02757 family protein [Vicinamibacteria bacterium]
MSRRHQLLLEGLERLRERYDARYLESDPLAFPHRYQDPMDREVVGLVASALAFGNVASIRQSLERLCAWMGSRPAEFAIRLSVGPALRALGGFRHRWIDARDVVCLVRWAGLMIQAKGNIGAFFAEGYVAGDMAGSISAFRERALRLDHGGVYRSRRLPRSAGVRFFFPSVLTGACKRTNMYLRWMARPDDGVDLGLWPFVKTRDLVVPLDTHIYRIGRALRWTRRKTPGWRTACDITRSLSRLDPDDPVKYDFALSRMGILHDCPRHRNGLSCELCELRRSLRAR